MDDLRVSGKLPRFHERSYPPCAGRQRLRSNPRIGQIGERVG